jgi:hypothetical protein
MDDHLRCMNAIIASLSSEALPRLPFYAKRPKLKQPRVSRSCWDSSARPARVRASGNDDLLNLPCQRKREQSDPPIRGFLLRTYQDAVNLIPLNELHYVWDDSDWWKQPCDVS